MGLHQECDPLTLSFLCEAVTFISIEPVDGSNSARTLVADFTEGQLHYISTEMLKKSNFPYYLHFIQFLQKA